MLKKLFKYDFKAVGRLWWIMAVIVVGMSFLGSLVLRFLIETDGNESLSLFWILGILFLIACLICVFGSILVTYFLVFWRYYQHLFSDEGYLTFTLPVTRRDILISKTLNSVIWITLHTILLVICAGIFMLLAPPTGEGGEIINTVVFTTIGDLFSFIPAEVGGWIALFAVEALILVLLSGFFTVCLVQLCITIGAIIAKKAKIVAAIGIYYLANMIISSVVQLGGTLGTLFLGSGINIVLANATIDQSCGVIALGLLIFAVMMVAFIATVHFVTQGMLERKLNLA